MKLLITEFLKTELTIIPELLDKYFGKYYNNALCNGATWMFIIWFILHFIFEDFLNALLKKMKRKEYIRIGLQESLWYLGFYITALAYCIATLWRNDLKIIGMMNFYDERGLELGHFLLGFIVILTFYLHSAFWEGIQYGNGVVGLKYSCLFFVLLFLHFLRFLDGVFRLTVLISFVAITLELTKCSVLIGSHTLGKKILVHIFFISNILIFILNYGLLVPMLFMYSVTRYVSPSHIVFLICLIAWLACEIYASALYKAVYHWFNHLDQKSNCKKDFFQCSLFTERYDAKYHFLQLRKEMKERQEESKSLRKPKNRNVVFQTLKCMVAIKRKLNQKRLASSSVKEDIIDSCKNDENNIHVNSELNNFDNASTSVIAVDETKEVVDGKLEFNINSNNYKHKQE